MSAERWAKRVKLVEARSRLAEDLLAGKRDDLLTGDEETAVFAKTRPPADAKVPEFVVDYHSTTTLSTRDVWSGKYGPKNPTAQDVLDKIVLYADKCSGGNVLRECQDWNLTTGGVLTVRKLGAGEDIAEVTT